MNRQKITLIAGPTASGKSALALDFARKFKGTVINADAMQVYSGLPILTAQPDKNEIPHALYETVDPAERFSAGKWVEAARKAMKESVEAGRTPILVGGTGLYFKAFLGGLADIPVIPEEVREEAQNLYRELGEEKFRQKLSKLDPESAARLARNDRQRLIRAYEVAGHTGRPIGHWQKKSSKSYSDTFDVEPHLLMPPREELYAACNRRFEKMIGQGAIEEVREFLKRRIDPTLPSMKIIGAREIAAYLSGEITREEAIARAQQATRNYAKRQMTWFRNQWPFN